MMFLDADSVSTSLTTRSIAVDLSDEQWPLLTVRYDVRANAAGDRRPVVLHFGHCPLWLISIEGSEFEAVFHDDQAHRVPETISVYPRPGMSWQARSEIRIKLRWTASAPHPSLLGQSHLTLPVELPLIGRGDITEKSVYAQVPVSLQGRAEQLLAGSISNSINSPADTADPLLLAVLTRSSYDVVEIERRDSQLRLLGTSKEGLSNDNRRQIFLTLQQMARYVGDKLGAHPGLRIAVDLNATQNTRSVSGPLLTHELSRFRLPELKQPGYEFPVARDVAGIWWGAGIRIRGDDGIHLANGISFAIGLAWAESHMYKKTFNALLEFYRQQMVSTPRFKGVDYRPGERSIGMGMVIYEVLARRESLWRSLDEMTKEFWGYYVPEELVLGGLEKGGVARRDFARRHFRRVDI